MWKVIRSAFHDYVEHRLSVGSVVVGTIFLVTFLVSLFKVVHTLMNRF